MITGTLTWPLKQPGSDLDYGLDLSCIPTSQTITMAALRILPSGAGEMVAQSLDLIGTELVAVLAGGVPGRYYRVQVDVTTNDGTLTRTYEWLIGLQIDPELSIYPLPLPASPGFGPVITWP
ncbi:hypothetical protein [Rhodopila sp.]|uniref:phage fiber-tail adaptor protein n=1 Tax=Rhodopila sp. TaxID=2480087 RepID=UPI003D12A01B